jgi:DNA-binding CsgD family transcriptional regulator
MSRNGYHHPRREHELTDLERRVLAAYAAGARRAEIAARIGLADRTVGTYLTVAKEKLGARTLAHAAALCAARET